MRNIGEQLASPYIDVRQQLELLRDALRHFLDRNAELVDVVTLRVDGLQAYGLHEPTLTKAVDCSRERAQAPGQHLKYQQPGQQGEQYGANDEIGRQLQKPTALENALGHQEKNSAKQKEYDGLRSGKLCVERL